MSASEQGPSVPTLTASEIAGLVALEQKATPGLWGKTPFEEKNDVCIWKPDGGWLANVGNWGNCQLIVEGEDGPEIAAHPDLERIETGHDANAEFICALRNAAPTLLAMAGRCAHYEEREGQDNVAYKELRAERDALKLRCAEQAKEIEDRRDEVQLWVDRSAHYRNLAFEAGVKRELLDNEDDARLIDLWEANQAERDALKAEVARLREALDDIASVSVVERREGRTLLGIGTDFMMSLRYIKESTAAALSPAPASPVEDRAAEGEGAKA